MSKAYVTNGLESGKTIATIPHCSINTNEELISAYLRIILAWSLCAHTGIKINLKRMEYSWILKIPNVKG